MGLTFPPGPLSRHPGSTNYETEGPAHRLLATPFPRRARCWVDDVCVVDTERALLVHETGIIARLYVPFEDLDHRVLVDSPTETTCPFKGTARYHGIDTGRRRVADALWRYADPLDEVRWLAGYVGVDEGRFDRLFDEAEEVYGHFRDPYHRVDVRPSHRRVRVTGPDGAVWAETEGAVVVSETGMANRLYVPRPDVAATLLPSATTARCPYKGTASYWSVGRWDDVAWSYEDPLDGAVRLTGAVCFAGTGVTVTELQGPEPTP